MIYTSIKWNQINCTTEAKSLKIFDRIWLHLGGQSINMLLQKYPGEWQAEQRCTRFGNCKVENYIGKMWSWEWCQHLDTGIHQNCTKSHDYGLRFSGALYFQWHYTHDILRGHHFSRDRFESISKYVSNCDRHNPIDWHVDCNRMCGARGKKSKARSS